MTLVDHVQARAGAITLLTLLALPAFIYPARRLGPRIQKLARAGMQQNAEMNNITAERFNVAGRDARQALRPARS